MQIGLARQITPGMWARGAGMPLPTRAEFAAALPPPPLAHASTSGMQGWPGWGEGGKAGPLERRRGEGRASARCAAVGGVASLAAGPPPPPSIPPLPPPQSGAAGPCASRAGMAGVPAQSAAIATRIPPPPLDCEALSAASDSGLSDDSKAYPLAKAARLQAPSQADSWDLAGGGGACDEDTSSARFGPPPPPSWTPADSAALYNVAGWSDGYFGVNAEGNLAVTPLGGARGGGGGPGGGGAWLPLPHHLAARLAVAACVCVCVWVTGSWPARGGGGGAQLQRRRARRRLPPPHTLPHTRAHTQRRALPWTCSRSPRPCASAGCAPPYSTASWTLQTRASTS